MTDNKQNVLREPKSLSKVSGEILWHIEPPKQDILLCRAVIFDFIRRSGGDDKFEFVPLKEGKKYLKKYNLPEDYNSSVLLIDDIKNKIYKKSDAVLQITKRLNKPWYVLYIFFVIPRRLRDGVYNFIARHRHLIS